MPLLPTTIYARGCHYCLLLLPTTIAYWYYLLLLPLLVLPTTIAYWYYLPILPITTYSAWGYCVNSVDMTLLMLAVGLWSVVAVWATKTPLRIIHEKSPQRPWRSRALALHSCRAVGHVRLPVPIVTVFSTYTAPGDCGLLLYRAVGLLDTFAFLS